jgi:aminoglycoside 6'-N-acetyltransferase
MRNFTFRRLTTADLPLMQRWLEAPHVRAWWPDAERHVAMMLDDLNSPAVHMHVVCLINHPFAYVVDYDAKAYGQPQYADLPPGARAMDSFVGDSAFMGQGHASGYIGARVRDLRLHHPMIAVGPNTKDTHAINIYNQAGFMKRRLAAARDGRLIQVMTHL